VKTLLGKIVAGAVSVLVLVLVAEWLPGSEPVITAPPISHTSHSSSPETETAAKDTDAWARTILRRPLFTVGRKPPKGRGAVSVASSNGLPRLAGIMITGAGKRAIFMPEGGKPLTLSEGALVDEYTIRRIAADHVVLSGAKGDLTVRPTYDTSGHAVATTFNPPVFGQPGFNPGFPQPGLNPGFQQPGFNPGFQPPQGVPQPANNQNNDDNSDGQVVTPGPQGPPVVPGFPGFRGPFIPRGRS
jgi:hypothetical protein